LCYGPTSNNVALQGSSVFQGITNNFSNISSEYNGSGLSGAVTNQIVDMPIYLVADSGFFVQNGNSPLKLTLFYTISSV
jgi:hypothetical protein